MGNVPVYVVLSSTYLNIGGEGKLEMTPKARGGSKNDLINLKIIIRLDKDLMIPPRCRKCEILKKSGTP